MKTMFAKAGLALALGATALTAAVPAQAQRYWGHRGHDNTGTAIVAGVAGLAIGAAIASSAHRDRYYDNGYYDQGYYDGGYYGPAYAYDGYYRAPPRVYYDRRYYDRRDYRRYDDRGGYYRGGYGHYGYDRGGYGYRR
ncbi:hypothetical protein NDN01_25135 [Sphingomonas sp. QA11]|uniref:hypothetical protein n=1 Tax=Sphingomonas sp. QA11 TaxID=2950605 RepID=UPI0023493BC8|nr:hypothetical protein [Sphingomonas sp. QA11]WCM27229.1 hypothetical protein NDN01_25135 [Sphingomonas sp. QA11]